MIDRRVESRVRREAPVLLHELDDLHRAVAIEAGREGAVGGLAGRRYAGIRLGVRHADGERDHDERRRDDPAAGHALTGSVEKSSRISTPEVS